MVLVMWRVLGMRDDEILEARAAHGEVELSGGEEDAVPNGFRL